MLPLATQSTAERIARLASKEKVSATTTLATGDFLRTVLIGGPGQGKSTLGQFVAQIHRAHLLQRAHELDADQLRFLPTTVRIPVRIILKDYAQAMTEGPGPHALEFYIASLFTERAARGVSAENIQEIIRTNPTLLILDGLDEVTDRKLRDRMLQYVSEFIGRVEDVLHGDLQVIATSRPTGYSDQFDPSCFLHLELAAMDAESRAGQSHNAESGNQGMH
jgi:predicted NACHT family NTPase